MKNSKLTKQFTIQYRDEIATLVTDLGLTELHIGFEGKKPDGLDEDPTLMWQYRNARLKNVAEEDIVIRLHWANIIDTKDELQYGLLILAHCLRHVWQKKTNFLGAGSLACPSCDDSIDLRKHDAVVYAYEAVQCLFALFSSDEAEALQEMGCPCKWCRQEAVSNLRRQGQMTNLA